MRDRLRLRVGSLSLAMESIPVISGDVEQVSANTHRPCVMHLFGEDPTLSPCSPFQADFIGPLKNDLLRLLQPKLD